MWGSLRLWVERGSCGCRGIAEHTVHRARVACNVQAVASPCYAVCWGDALCVQALIALLGPRASAGARRSRGTQVAQVCTECGERVCAVAHAGCAARVRLCDRRVLEMLSVQWGASSTARVGFGCGEGLSRAGRGSHRRRQVMRSACACGACWLCDFAGQCSI